MEWIYRKDLVPANIRAEGAGGNTLSIHAFEAHYCFGRGVYPCGRITPGFVYRCSVPFHQRKADGFLQIIANLEDTNGNPVARLYLDRKDEETFSAVFEALPGSDTLRLEAQLWSTDGGEVVFYTPKLECLGLYTPRNVVLGTAWFDTQHGPTLEQNLNNILRITDAAGREKEKPDLLVFSEAIYGRNVELPLDQRAVSLDSPQVRRIQEMAARHRLYLVVGMHIKEGGCFKNAAVLIDRDGRIQDVYIKTHLTITEREIGLVPGMEQPVFDVDFGRLGILICYDHYFCEPARLLHLQNAEVIAVPTAGDTEWQSRARAEDSGAWVIRSGMHTPDSGLILDPYGETIATIADPQKGYTCAKVDLNRRNYTPWLSVGPCYGEGRNVYRHDRRPDLYGPLCNK